MWRTFLETRMKHADTHEESDPMVMVMMMMTMMTMMILVVPLTMPLLILMTMRWLLDLHTEESGALV